MSQQQSLCSSLLLKEVRSRPITLYIYIYISYFIVYILSFFKYKLVKVLYQIMDKH